MLMRKLVTVLLFICMVVLSEAKPQVLASTTEQHIDGKTLCAYYDSISAWDNILEYGLPEDLICTLPAVIFILLGVLCGWGYRKKLSKGRRIKFLDFLGGLFVCIAFIIFACNFGDGAPDWLPRLESGFWEIIMLSVYISVLYLIWGLIIKYIKVGPNWMYCIVTFLFFAILTLHIIIEEFMDRGGYGFWVLVAFIVIPLAAFAGFCMLLRFMNFNRCPICHAAGSRNIVVDGTDDLGYSTKYSTEYKNSTEHDSDDYKDTTRYITKKYNVAKTSHNYRHHLRCRVCGGEWTGDFSHPVSTDKDLDSITTETHTTTYE